MHDQGIDLLITNKISNAITTDLSNANANNDLSDSLASANQLSNLSTANSFNLVDEANSDFEIKIDLLSNNIRNMKNQNSKSAAKALDSDQQKVNSSENNTFSICSSSVNSACDQKRFSETSFPASISFLRNPTVMPSLNNAGYCVDSVEPKCNELKRLIDEFKFSYMQKLNIFKSNKIILKKLNIVSLFFKLR